MSEALDFGHYPFDPTSLPAGWVVTSVGAVAADIKSGFASGAHNSEGRGLPHLRPMNVGPNGEIDLSDLRYVDDEGGPRLAPGDVLFNNTNSPAWVGKTALVTQDAPLAFSNHMTRLRMAEGVVPRFAALQLQYLCTSGYFRHRCKKHVNQASISPTTLAETVPFVLPPTAAQCRIVATLDELLASGRAARAALDAVPALLEQYRQAVLAAAFRGDVTAGWRADVRADEDGGALVAHIVDERRARGCRPAVYTNEAGAARWTLPAGWTWSRFGDLFDVYVGGTPGRAEPAYWDGDIPWVSSGEVAFSRLDDTRERITARGLAESAAKLHPVGTVLLGMIGEGKTRGQAAILGIPAAHSQNSAAIRVSETPIIPEFVFYYLRQRYDVTRTAGSGNGQQALNKARVQSFELPVPPVAEQRAIVDWLLSQMTGIDRLATLLEELRFALGRLEQAALVQAFRGELVSSDPADEPAFVLLERLRTASGATSAPRRPRRIPARA